MRRSKTAATTKAASPSAAYEAITERIVTELKAGTAPWRQPWNATLHAPRNISGRRYSGINVFLLLIQHYESPYWMTFGQARNLGGHVIKGQHGTLIVFWRFPKLRDDKASEAQGKEVWKVVPMLRTYTVFNVEQTEGVKLPKAVTTPIATPDPSARIEAAEEIFAGYEDPPQFVEGGPQAYYEPARDLVQVPERASFASLDGYWTTVFHELGHSTGAKKRLARPGITELTSTRGYSYGREELVAEMTAAFLSGEAGILPATIENSARYLNFWIGAIQEDPRAVVVAAGAAQRAANLILGRTAQEETAEATEAPAPAEEVVA